MTDWQRACVGSPGMLFGFPPDWCSASPECAPEQIIEILLGVAVKTISNYLDHISAIEVDPAFRGRMPAEQPCEERGSK